MSRGCDAARWHPSPNFGPRRDGLRPDLVVLHYTGMSSAQAALERLCDPGAEVSAHYLIGADGRLWQLVAEAQRAWHAGAGAWLGRVDVNSRSIGIELENPGDRPFPAPQMQRLEALLAGVLARWGIPPAGVIGHADMAPGRKHDPGPRFDWRRLARSGLALRPGAAPPGPWPAFAPTLDAIGYPPAPEAARLAAFRARFRPQARDAAPHVTDADRAVAAAVLTACRQEAGHR
ncbi:MAG: N-acetylmuramoyl-L-alanine amidase [Rhodobacteraceae bacterium]|nr:N-acetylmuramoyl-L-alanine amidase [Paracoccaceae bacterium]